MNVTLKCMYRWHSAHVFFCIYVQFEEHVCKVCICIARSILESWIGSFDLPSFVSQRSKDVAATKAPSMPSMPPETRAREIHLMQPYLSCMFSIQWVALPLIYLEGMAFNQICQTSHHQPKAVMILPTMMF